MRVYRGEVRGQLWGFDAFLLPTGSGNRTQMVRLGSHSLYPLSHLAGRAVHPLVGTELLLLLECRVDFKKYTLILIIGYVFLNMRWDL